MNLLWWPFNVELKINKSNNWLRSAFIQVDLVEIPTWVNADPSQLLELYIFNSTLKGHHNRFKIDDFQIFHFIFNHLYLYSFFKILLFMFKKRSNFATLPLYEPYMTLSVQYIALTVPYMVINRNCGKISALFFLNIWMRI